MNKPGILSNKSILYGILATGIIVLTLLNFWGWFFIGTLQKDILLQLKKQLKHIGTTTGKLIAGEDLEGLIPGDETTPPALYHQQLLWEIKQSGELENIMIISLDQHLLIDYRINFHIGDNLKVPINRALFTQALGGESPDPELIRFADQYFLTTYTPIMNDLGEVVAVLFMETPAQFFSTLNYLREGLLYFGLGGLAVILIFASIILLAVRQIFSVERKLQEQTRLAQLGQMAAIVAHEIRNPLSIIKGSTDVLKKKYASQGDELFTFIPEEIERLNRLVNDFLQFARGRKLNFTRVNLNKMIENILSQLKDHRIELRLERDCPQIMLDRDAIRQVLLNIVENARQAIPNQGKIIISTRLQTQKSRRIILEINDTGKGMDSETLSRIFEPFYSKKATGSGLGMTITKQLVEQMRGKISVQSQPGKGTTVTIEFPI